MRGRPWTPADTATLRRMARVGYSDVEIASHIGRHPKLVACKRRELRIAAGLSPMMLTALRRLTLRRLLAA